jgi:hypothetical protein
MWCILHVQNLRYVSAAGKVNVTPVAAFTNHVLLLQCQKVNPGRFICLRRLLRHHLISSCLSLHPLLLLFCCGSRQLLIFLWHALRQQLTYPWLQGQAVVAVGGLQKT